MAVIGEDSRFESFLMALFSNFAKAIGKDMEKKQCDELIRSALQLKAGEKTELPFVRSMLSGKKESDAQGGTMMKIERAQNGLLTAVAEFCADQGFSESDMLAIHKASDNIPIFVIYASEEYSSECGETDFRDGEADNSFGNGNEAYTFFMVKNKGLGGAKEKLPLLLKMNTVSAQDDCAEEVVADLLSFYEYLDEDELASADEVARLREEDADGYYDQILATADLILWDAANSSELKVELCELGQLLEEKSTQAVQ